MSHFPNRPPFSLGHLVVLALVTCATFLLSACGSEEAEPESVTEPVDKTPTTPAPVVDKIEKTPTARPVISIDADTALGRFATGTLDEIFASVSDRVKFVPYAGVQRGAAGTALTGRGNAFDQSLLLAELIKSDVSAWRFAQGRLDAENLAVLLNSVAPESTGIRFVADRYELYTAADDLALQRVARDHVWLEIQRDGGDEWQALDPSFPGARPGEAFAGAQRHFDQPAPAAMQRLDLTVMQQTADGRSRRLGRVSGNVADLAPYPIALVVRGIPQLEDSGAQPDSGGGLMGGGGLLGGALGGDQRTAPANEEGERTIIGTEYRRELSYGGKAPETLTATLVENARPDTRIVREWIEFSLRAPGVNRKFSRDLYVSASDDDAPAVIRRYSIAIIPGEMSRAMFEGYRQGLDRIQIGKAEAQLAKLKAESPDNETALKLLNLESANALTPHLINLAFAMESDTLSQRLAAGAGIAVVRELPRVLITSIETGLTQDGSVTSHTSLDLRLDEVRAIPANGRPTSAAALFQRARGMQESALEGRVLARFVKDSDSVVTTARIMRETQSQGHELLLVLPQGRSSLNDTKDLPALVAARINAALDAGRQVIVPAAAASIGGVSHWGWWEVDPASGAFVGVMANGQHQAMVQYTVTLEEIGVNDSMGYVIGAIVGATATVTLYAAKMIEYGQVTPQLIQEVAAGIEHLTCVTCPRYDVHVSPISASASVESPCFEQTGAAIGTGGGFSGQVSFCENYKLGISCAASLMLGTFEVSADVSVGPDVALDLGPISCE